MKRLAMAAVCVAALASCGKKAEPGGKPKELHLFIWANYIDPAVLRDFEKESGIKVVEENFDSNETLRAKLEAGATGYDVIVPSDYTVQGLKKAGLLAELDLSNIPNAKHLSKRFQQIWYDPGNKVSIPYLWGTTGIGYDVTKVVPPPTSWADLFAKENLEKYKGKIGMLDDAREALGAALRFRGNSVNSVDRKEIEQARDLLVAQKPSVARYDSETYDDMVSAGTLVMAQGWSGDFAKAHAENPNVRFVVPKEGGVTWADNLAIPKSSANKAAAEAFIDYLMRPEISARIVNFIRYPSSNEDAKSLIKPEILNDPGIYPPPAILDNLEWIHDPGELGDLYDNAWTELKNK
ncbi:MAG: spermidine/putrescine ABC transporter substrate-binding protein [Planctomycetes bacterium]|nr:spermidine/putrescine ABC transporter substrate-binding protein [Planctomycetota bacterium]